MTKELSYMSEIMLTSFEEKSEGFSVFRVKIRVNNLAFYSEELTKEDIIKNTTKDGNWLISFDGIVSLEAQGPEGDWVVI